MQQTEPQVPGGRARALVGDDSQGSKGTPRALPPLRCHGSLRALYGAPGRNHRPGALPQALLAVKSMPMDEDAENEVPTHPEDGAPQPGNSKVRGVQVGGCSQAGWRDSGGLVGIHSEVGPAPLLHLKALPPQSAIKLIQVWEGRPELECLVRLGCGLEPGMGVATCPVNLEGMLDLGVPVIPVGWAFGPHGLVVSLQ